MGLMEKNSGNQQKYKVYLKAASALRNHHKKIESGKKKKIEKKIFMKGISNPF